MDEVINFIKETISLKDKIIVACSGGPDSMCLLNILHELNYKIICAHVDHNVRKSSLRDLKLVKDYCNKKGIIFKSMTIQDLKENNFENEARKIRYEYFLKLAKENNAKVICTAHHGDDLVETILMRLERGSSLKGYAGIRSISNYHNNIKIIRPLLFVTKKDIEIYNNQKHIDYAIDETNELNDHKRNRYRHNILPILKEEDKDIHLKYLKFSDELNKTFSYITKNVYKYLDKYENQYSIKSFLKEDEYLQTKIIEEIFRRIYLTDLDRISSDLVKEVMKAINSSKPNIIVKLPNNILFIKEYDYFYIKSNINKDSEYDVIFNKKYETDNYLIEVSQDENDTSNYCIRLNSKEIKLPIHIRSRKQGDKISVLNMNGSKKIKDIYIDEKIPNEKRKYIPIICDDGDQILWVPGIKKSKFAKDINEKYDILVKYKLKEGETNEKK